MHAHFMAVAALTVMLAGGAFAGPKQTVKPKTTSAAVRCQTPSCATCPDKAKCDPSTCKHCAETARKSASRPSGATKPAVVDVKVCPMMRHPVSMTNGTATVYGKYRVAFCCPDCKAKFEKLSKAERQRRIEAALKLQ